MKRNNILAYFIAAAGIFFCGTASAQALHSGYFLEGYTYRHLMNPAFEPERNYVSIPGIGNINMGTQSNVGLNTFLYPYGNGKLTTFMNSAVSSDEFLGKLKDNNRINMNMNLTLLSVGFRAWGGFNTFDVSLRSNTSLNLPRGLFEFMKVGMDGTNPVYEMDGLGISSNNYAEIALGHSHQINERLRIGAKVKALLGLGNASIKMTDMKVQMAENQWMVQANGELNASVKGLTLPTKGESGKTLNNPSEATLIDWDNMDIDSPGLSGYGMAVDLGATYKLLDNLTLSAALLDLGFISWSNTIKGATSNEPWLFDGFHNIAMGSDDPNGDKPLEDQLEDLGKDVENYASFHRTETGGSATKMLGATLNIGADYAFPLYDKLHFGFLSSTRINGPYSWSEGRLSANVSPVKWFDAGVKYGLSTFGSSFGWILNFHPCGFNFFVGMDHTLTKVTPQYIPVGNANTNVSLGFNITFGKRK